jgi:hypothetical protein
MLVLEYMPPVVKGLCLAALLAIIMSTADTVLLISGTTVSRNIVSQFRAHGCPSACLSQESVGGKRLRVDGAAAAARGVPERALQSFLGHADVRSTRRYARLADGALLEVLRPPRGADGARGAKRIEKGLQKQRVSGGGGGNRTRRNGATKSKKSGTSKPRSGRGQEKQGTLRRLMPPLLEA